MNPERNLNISGNCKTLQITLYAGYDNSNDNEQHSVCSGSLYNPTVLATKFK